MQALSILTLAVLTQSLISSLLVSSLHWVDGMHASETSQLCSHEGLKPSLNLQCKGLMGGELFVPPTISI